MLKDIEIMKQQIAPAMEQCVSDNELAKDFGRLPLRADSKRKVEKVKCK